MGNAIFGVCQHRNPWVDFQKILHGWLRWDPPHTQVLGLVGSKRACLCMCEIVTLRRLFFPFLGFMRLATGRPVGPIVAVNGSNDAPWWPLRPFNGFVNKNFFPIFHPKMWKIALYPMVTLNSHNFGVVEDTYKLVAPKWGFSGSANLMVSSKLTPDQPLLPW